MRQRVVSHTAWAFDSGIQKGWQLMPRILLVDDMDDNRDMLTRRLQKRGYEVVCAVDGAQACEMAESEKPDLILMDMQMPVMDGYEATRIIKEGPTTGGIPVVGLTAHAMAGDREKAIEAGCDDYEAKPINFSQLLDTMQTLLEKPTAT